jgi:hypothetical protein
MERGREVWSLSGREEDKNVSHLVVILRSLLQNFPTGSLQKSREMEACITVLKPSDALGATRLFLCPVTKRYLKPYVSRQYLSLVPRLIIVELYLHSPIRPHDVKSIDDVTRVHSMEVQSR